MRRGDRVGILLPNCPAFVESLFGASLLGAVPVLINARYRTEELAYVTGNAEIRVILTTDLIADRVDFAALLSAALPGLSEAGDPAALQLRETPSLRACVLLGETTAPGFLDAAGLARLGAGVPEHVIEDAAAAVAIRDDAIVMYTSGTTAHPKGCRLSHEAVVRTAAAMVQRYGLTSEDVWWCPLPLCHMSGVLPLAATLLADSRFACMVDFEPGAALRQIEQERATFHFGIFPTVNQALVDHPDRATTDLSSVRLMNIQGTTRLREALRDAHPNATLLHAYGCTELGGIVSLTDPAMPGDELAQTSGTPWPGMQIRIVDPESGDDVATGTRGEILARGWGMFEGYIPGPPNDPARSRCRRLVPHGRLGQPRRARPDRLPRPAQGHAQDRRRERRGSRDRVVPRGPSRGRRRPGRGGARRPPGGGGRAFVQLAPGAEGFGVRADRVLPRPDRELQDPPLRARR